MVKTKYETKTHTVTEKVMVSEKRYCDICGSEITDHHWHLETWHSDWGNDSWESREEFDICCPVCLREKFDEYLEDSNSDYNTMRFGVEHINHADVKGDITYDEKETV